MNCRDRGCQEIPVQAGWSHCAACHQSFTSDTAFDEHRVGVFGVDRRCLTPDEMSDSGILRDRRGFWMSRGAERLTSLMSGQTDLETASQGERSD